MATRPIVSPNLSRSVKNKLHPLRRHPDLVVSSCGFGRGIFTTTFLPADTTLEECPFLRIPSRTCTGILDDYVFDMEPEDGEEEGDWYSLVLGWGSLFNHSDQHNTEYWYDPDRLLIVFHTIRPVEAGNQLFVNYGKTWWDSRRLTPG